MHEVPTTIGGLLDRAATLWPARTALIHGDRSLTFAEADSSANQVANLLLDHGIRPGDRVGYLGRNTLEYFKVFWGAAKAGAIFVPFNWRLSRPELSVAVTQTSPVLIFASADFVDDLQAVTSVSVVAVGANGEALSDRLAEVPADPPAVTVRPDDVALILLTSGTTGTPKGAMLTGDSMIWMRTHQPDSDSWSRWGQDETLLLSMPLFHIGGIALSINSLVYGARIVLIEEFDPKVVLEIISRYQVTRFFIVPAAINALLAAPDISSTDLSHVRCVSYGASPISPELLAASRDVFGGKFVQNYGITETSGTIAVLPAEDHAVESPRLLSAGRALDGVEVKVVDETGTTVSVGRPGEILIRSRAVMKGYWQDPDATAEAIDGDGWFRSGDVGHLDEDGYIYLGARLKDMIVSGGENIYPREVEIALLEHADIADAVVFGIPDDRWGEAVHAELVLRDGVDLDLDELRSWLRSRLAGYKLPRSFGVLDDLPRNAVGKVLRRSLRDPHWSHLARHVG